MRHWWTEPPFIMLLHFKFNPPPPIFNSMSKQKSESTKVSVEMIQSRQTNQTQV